MASFDRPRITSYEFSIVTVLLFCTVFEILPPFQQPFVKRFVLCYLSVLSVCLSVCDVAVLWPNGGWIKIKLGTHVGLGPGHIVLDGDPAAPP